MSGPALGGKDCLVPRTRLNPLKGYTHPTHVLTRLTDANMGRTFSGSMINSRQQTAGQTQG